MSNTGSGGAAERSSSPNPQHSGDSGRGGSSSPQQTPPVAPPRPEMGRPGQSAFVRYTPRPEMGRPGQSAFTHYTPRPQIGHPGQSAFARYMPRPELGGPGSAFSRPPPRPTTQTPPVVPLPPPPRPEPQQCPRTRVAPPPPPPPPPQRRVTGRPGHSAFRARSPPPQLRGGPGLGGVNLDGSGFVAAQSIPVGGDFASGSGGIRIGGPSGSKSGVAPQPRPQNENENVNNNPWTCFVCQRQFMSFKALCGHLRHHRNRGWRGIRPPPGFNAEEEFIGVPHLNVGPRGGQEVAEAAGDGEAAAEDGGAPPPVSTVPDFNVAPREDED